MRAVYADSSGRLFDTPDCAALGRTAELAVLPESADWIELPPGATLVSLPGTRALVDDGEGLKALQAEVTAVGAILPQGYTRLYLPAYHKSPDSSPLPLFGYTAVGFDKGRFYATALRSDDPQAFSPLQYDDERIRASIRDALGRYPNNRLYEHLRHCALEYECMTARHTFCGRMEAAVPVSPTCNAACVGCISEQPDDAGFPSPQTRLAFRPSSQEMAELILDHFARAGKDAIASFGQGCEGEPSVRARDIAEAIRLVREQSADGYVNINTNAGLTRELRRIVAAGLNLMRISTVSALSEHYDAYYRPRGYGSDDVYRSAFEASEAGVITSINWLIFPGVSDQPSEIAAMARFISDTGIRLVQLRNLNIDADTYLARLPGRREQPLGMRAMISELRRHCPGLRFGSYTHPPSWYHTSVGAADERDRNAKRTRDGGS
ncbi:MAG: radical SAM protein [Firmicutes bacterium]|nr:radical SAM protein [Bacillota bacterium]